MKLISIKNSKIRSPLYRHGIEDDTIQDHHTIEDDTIQDHTIEDDTIQDHTIEDDLT